MILIWSSLSQIPMWSMHLQEVSIPADENNVKRQQPLWASAVWEMPRYTIFWVRIIENFKEAYIFSTSLFSLDCVGLKFQISYPPICRCQRPFRQCNVQTSMSCDWRDWAYGKGSWGSETRSLSRVWKANGGEPQFPQVMYSITITFRKLQNRVNEFKLEIWPFCFKQCRHLSSDI